MSWLTGSASSLLEVAAKAVLVYVTAVIVLRLSERRTLAQWTIIDFATAVAMGAIIGRTAVANGQSYVSGAVAIVTLALVHRAASLLRLTRPGRRALDHDIRVLVVDGVIRHDELRRCGLSADDLSAQLRQHGTFDIEHIRYVFYEARGGLTIVPSTEGRQRLVAEAIDQAVNYPLEEGHRDHT